MLLWRIHVFRTAIVVLGSYSMFFGTARAEEVPATPKPRVRLVRVPDGGLQPQAVANSSGIHVVYFKGDPKAGDLYYSKLDPRTRTFGRPMRVNNAPGSAIAVGNIRGAQLAVSESGRVHVLWNGSSKAEPKAPAGGTPLLYTRLNDAGTAFEPQRNLILKAEGLDGGSSITIDHAGFVYVFWHAGKHDEGEAGRRIWMRVSNNEGKTFSIREIPLSDASTGVCGCCGIRGWVQNPATPMVLYRSATDRVHRDTYLVYTPFGATENRTLKLHDWRVNLCPMSSFALMSIHEQTLAAWETDGQIYFARLQLPNKDPIVLKPQAVPGAAGRRKHPAVAYDGVDSIIVWTEGMAWNRGGSVAWQVYDYQNKPTRDAGRANGVPTWGLVAVVATQDGFVIVY